MDHLIFPQVFADLHLKSHLSVVQQLRDPLIGAIVPDKMLSKSKKKLSSDRLVSVDIRHIFHHRSESLFSLILSTRLNIAAHLKRGLSPPDTASRRPKISRPCIHVCTFL